MSKFIARLLSGAVAILGLLTTGAFGQQKVIKIDGSSTVYPITEAVAEEFQNEHRGAVKVTVGISGTGGGFKKFVRGETDISDASRPILQEERQQAKKNGIKFLELPVAFDALTVMIHPSNTWAASLSVDELKHIWEPSSQRNVTNWNQVRSTFPDAPLKLYGAGSDSGTFDYFTEAIVGKAKASRGDYTGSEDDNVLVQGIANDKHALGYFGYAYYAENKDKLKAVAIAEGKRKPVLPSIEAVVNGSYQPLSRPIFIYVNAQSLGRAEVRNFVQFYLENAEQLAKEVKYIPLAPEAYQKGLARLKANQTGTVFEGHAQVGVKASELFSRPLKD